MARICDTDLSQLYLTMDLAHLKCPSYRNSWTDRLFQYKRISQPICSYRKTSILAFNIHPCSYLVFILPNNNIIIVRPPLWDVNVYELRVSLRSYANVEGYGELSFVFIESKPLVQQLGLALYSDARTLAVAQFANA